MAGKELVSQYQEIGQRKIQSECGLFAVFYPGHDVRSIAYRAGTDLQHRAEGAAGMYASDGVYSDTVRNLGTVAVAFQEGRLMPAVESPHLAIIHTRYPTAGGSNHTPNIQPLSIDGITMGHHGNLTNGIELRERMRDIRMGGDFPDNDSWLALNAVARASGNTLGEKLVAAQKGFEGAWAFIVTDGKQLVASRDPHGIRPLSLAYIGKPHREKGYLLSVETAPFNNLGIDDYREVLPGETIVIDEEGVRTIDISPKSQKSCIFEFVYMMRPDSIFMGEQVYMTRRRAGELLWQEQPVNINSNDRLIIMPVPDSGRPSAIGYFNEARKALGDRVDYDEALIGNRYFGRNFIKSSGERAAYLKYYAIRELVQDKIVVTIDDSLVRGETIEDIAKMLRDAGAREVHERVASPEIKHPCYWGVAFSKYDELIAENIPNLDERERKLDLDSLGYLSLEGLFKAVGKTPEEARIAAEKDNTRFCTHCFDGNGPEIRQNGIIELRESQKAVA